jgi:hypothetical protein
LRDEISSSTNFNLTLSLLAQNIPLIQQLFPFTMLTSAQQSTSNAFYDSTHNSNTSSSDTQSSSLSTQPTALTSRTSLDKSGAEFPPPDVAPEDNADS